MDLYTETSYEVSRYVTKQYSTSFSSSSMLFDMSIRQHIYAIYGLVRIADEVVDTYRGDTASDELEQLYRQTIAALATGYSTNPIVHAFAQTARRYGIDNELIDPFFESMRIDLGTVVFTQERYEQYIYGSAEVVGLMCLKVFTDNKHDYTQLAKGASALGAAYQKVNFLRDMKADYEELGRVYFPNVTFDTFDEAKKAEIIADIEKDFAVALKDIVRLPMNARRAVYTSYLYYGQLLEKLHKTPAAYIKQHRIRVSNVRKAWLLAKARAAV